MKLYFFNILVAIDLLLAAICKCKRNETLSAAAWSTELSGKRAGKFFRPLIDWIMSFKEANHCKVQYEFENPPRVKNE